MSKRKPVLVITLPTSTYEFYLLNSGERFEGFGGHSGGLLVGSTASMVVRHKTAGLSTDTEYDLAEGRALHMWEFVQKIVDHGIPHHVKASEKAA